MKAHRIIAIAAAAVLAVPTYSSAVESKAPHRIVGYLPDWNYQPFSELDLDELTHINIAFCNPDENGRLFCYIPNDILRYIKYKYYLSMMVKASMISFVKSTCSLSDSLYEVLTTIVPIILFLVYYISKHTVLVSLKSPLNSSETSRLPSSFSWTFIFRTSSLILVSLM